MSEWKNPNFPNHGRVEWQTPRIDEDEEIVISRTAMLVAIALRAVMGLVVMVSVNALCLWSVLSLLDYSISYLNCVLVALVYVPWRVYDSIAFRKARESRNTQ